MARKTINPPAFDPALVRAAMDARANGADPFRGLSDLVPTPNPFDGAPFADNPPAPAKLADTIPPTEPPEPAALADVRPHDVVRWHINPSRCTVEQFATLAEAQEHVATLHYAVFWKWAIRCPNPWPHTVETGLINPPADAPVASQWSPTIAAAE